MKRLNATRLSTAIVSICCFFPLFAQAEGLTYGWLPQLNYHFVDDPDGDTEDTSALNALSAFATYDLNRHSRVMVVGAQYSYDLDYTEGSVGQEVETTEFDITYQRKVNLSRDLKFWLGAGLGFSNTSYEDRCLIRSDGFCQPEDRLEDRDEDNISIVVNATTERFKLNEYWGVSVYTGYSQTVEEDGHSQFSVGVMIGYR